MRVGASWRGFKLGRTRAAFRTSRLTVSTPGSMVIGGGIECGDTMVGSRWIRRRKEYVVRRRDRHVCSAERNRGILPTDETGIPDHGRAITSAPDWYYYECICKVHAVITGAHVRVAVSAEIWGEEREV